MRRPTTIDLLIWAADALIVAWLLAGFAGCDKSTVIDFDVNGKVTTTVSDSPAPTDPTDPTVPPPVVQPPPVTPTGYDLNTQGILLEGFARLDPIGPADHVAIGPLGFPPTWTSPVAGLQRQNSCYRFVGGLVVPEDGEYTFTLEVKSGGHFIVDGEPLWSLDREADATSSGVFPKITVTKTLAKGVRPLDACVRYQGFVSGLTVSWQRPGKDAAEPISSLYLRPPADWQARLKTYQPPPPPESPFAEVNWATYQSPAVPADLPHFPGHPLNERIDQAELDPLSDAIIARMGAINLHPVFGQNGVGIPYEVVPDDTPLVNIGFDYAAESDPGPYPLTAKPVVEGGGGDGHWIGIHKGKLYELFLLRKEGTAWKGGSGAIFDCSTYTQRPAGWTSADASGAEIWPWLAKWDEVESGVINHAIRVSVPATRDAFVAPANHRTVKFGNAENLPPMGCRFRLKASFDISAAPPQCRPILEAAKTHGLFTSDNGGPFIGVCGTPDARWSDAELAWMKRVKASDLEVVKMGPITTQVP